MRHCCVIGGTGFIGSHVVDLLCSSAREITVVGRNSHPSRPLPRGVRYVSGDYGDKNLLLDVLRGRDEVIDLAYSTVPKTSFEDPVRDILSHLPASVTLFEVASTLDIKKLVFVSSGGTVYGKATKVPIDESHATNPISPYGITKLAIEKYALMFNDLKKLPVVCVRPGNAFGEGQRPFVEQGFVATAIASILRNRPIALFGETGTVRDYVYVTDVARGIVAALDNAPPGFCYNIGSGIGRSNSEVLDAIRTLAEPAGFEPQVAVYAPRSFDVPVNILDSSKLSRETGWRVSVPFEEGIGRAWAWFLNNC
jgi:UDP-glucose 4-epimerase